MSNITQTTTTKPRTVSLRAIRRESLIARIGLYIAAVGVVIERLTSRKVGYPIYLLAGLFLDFKTDVTKKRMRTRGVIAILKKRLV